MKKHTGHLSRAALILAMLMGKSAMAQDQTVSGNLTVDGAAVIKAGPLSLGVANFDDGTTTSTLGGLTINYIDTAQTWADNVYTPGHSSIVFQAAHELASFNWQVSIPVTGPASLMSLTNDGLTVAPSISGLAPVNTLPNQTLTAGNASILTKILADGLYVSKNGGTISGTLAVTNLTINGAEVLTKSGSGYVKDAGDGSIRGGHLSQAAEWTTAVVLGHSANAGADAVSIGGSSNTGEKAVAIGWLARALQHSGIAIGSETWSPALASIAIGQGAESIRNASIAMGKGASSTQPHQVVLGVFNTKSAIADILSPDLDLFVLGNGTADNARSNALVVKRNGNMEVKGTSLTVNGAEVLTAGNTNNYVKHVSSGAIQSELALADPAGGASVALGHFARAGAGAVSIGWHSGLWEPGFSGINSVAVGFSARAPSDGSIAIGESNWGGGVNSIAIGKYANVATTDSIAIGTHAVATRLGQIVLGAFNEYPTYSPTYRLPEDPLFILGNGTADNARSNALVVKRNGDMEVKGTSLKVNGVEVLTQTSASATYLTVADASTQYQTKPAGGVQFVTTDVLTSEIEDALQNIDLSGNYLSKDPLVGLAYGTGSQAQGGTSAIGTGAKANQAGAHAIGSHVVANRPGQIVVGSYNDYGSTEAGTSTESPEDAVFVVATGKAGTGGQPDERKNAIEVKRDGSVHIKTVLRVQPAGNLSMGDYTEEPAP